MRDLVRYFRFALAFPLLLVGGGGGGAGGSTPPAGTPPASGGSGTPAPSGSAPPAGTPAPPGGTPSGAPPPAGTPGAPGGASGDSSADGDGEGDLVPRALLNKVTAESINRKAKVRALEARVAELEGKGTPEEHLEALRKKAGDLEMENQGLRLRGELMTLTDGREGRPLRASDRVLELMAQDAAALEIAPGTLEDFVGDWSKANPSLLSVPSAPPASPAAAARAPDRFGRAQTPRTLDPAEELAAYRALSPAERREAESKDPDLRKRIKRYTIQDIRARIPKSGPLASGEISS